MRKSVYMPKFAVASAGEERAVSRASARNSITHLISTHSLIGRLLYRCDFKLHEFPNWHPQMSLYSSQIIRRSPWTCLSCSTLTTAAQTLAVSSTVRSSPARIHQCKSSSSKAPSSPKNESRALTAPAKSPPKETLPLVKDGADKRSHSRFGRRKSKDVVREVEVKANMDTTINVPSVPTTTHLHPSGMHWQHSTDNP